jgi:hypothetical protein
MLLALITSAAFAVCKTDTSAAKQQRTLASSLHIAALHLDTGGGSFAANGALEGMTESRLALAICDWPSYTIALNLSVASTSFPTAYTLPGSNGFRPDLYVSTSGWEIEKRWRDSSIFHPMVVFGTGTVRAQYHYTLITPTKTFDDSKEEPAAARYYMPAVGLEATLFKYVTIYTILGARFAGRMNLPGLDRGAFSGEYWALGMGFGKFR